MVTNSTTGAGIFVRGLRLNNNWDLGGTSGGVLREDRNVSSRFMLPGQPCPDPDLLPLSLMSVPQADCCVCIEHGPDWQGKIITATSGLNLLDGYLQKIDPPQSYYRQSPPPDYFYLEGAQPGGWDGSKYIVWSQGRLGGEIKPETNHYVVARTQLWSDFLQNGNVLDNANRLQWLKDRPVYIHAAPPGTNASPALIGMGIWAGSYRGGRAWLEVVGDGHFQVSGSGWSITNGQRRAWNAATDGASILHARCLVPGDAELRITYANDDVPGMEFRDFITLRGLEPLAMTPKLNQAYVWVPAPELKGSDCTEFANGLKNQGFQVEWLVDDGGTQTNTFGTCTLENFKKMANAGAIMVSAHGYPGVFGAVYAPLTPEGFEACNNWHRGNERGMATISNLVYDASNNIVLSNSYYCVGVNTTWLRNNWKPTLDVNEAITAWSVCSSASNSPTAGMSLIDAAGGRWRIGVEQKMRGYEGRDVIQAFFGRMNGTIKNGNLRLSGSAYNDPTIDYKRINNYGYDDDEDGVVDREFGSVKMSGNPWTTLCPAPLAINPVHPMSPVTAQRKGWGCILLDTEVSNSSLARDAVVKNSGGASISDTHWLKNTDGSFYGVGFMFDKTLDNSLTTMKAVADKIRNSETEGHAMDGDRVQPNIDDKQWSY